MIRILHTADIHLDSPLRALALRDPALRDRVQAATRGAVLRIVDAALDNDVRAVLIAGDLFDGASRSARSAAFLLAQFDRLAEAGIRVFWIKGNHDAENPMTGELDLPDTVHVFTAKGGKVALSDDIWIHGVSFADTHAPDSLLPRFGDPVAGAVNIAMLHTSLNGAPGHDPYAPCSTSDLRAMGFDYWALGHIHGRTIHAKDPWIVMPGTPQGRDIGETGPKSATLIEIDAGQITTRPVPTSIVEFHIATLDVSRFDTDEALRRAIKDTFSNLASSLTSDSGVVRLTLTGASSMRWALLRDRDTWTETADQSAKSTGRLWLDKVVISVTDPQTIATPSAVDELASIMDDILQEPGFTAQADALVDDLLGYLKAPELRRVLAPDEPTQQALARDAAAHGATDMVARMKGADR